MIAETATQAVNWGKGCGVIFVFIFVFLGVVPAIEYGIAKLIDRIFDSDLADDWSYGFGVGIGFVIVFAIGLLIMIAYKIGGGK